MIIVYCSKTGSSERYARELASRTGYGCYDVGGDYPAEGQIVYFGWLRAGMVAGLNRVDKSRLKAVCAVGIEDRRQFNPKRVCDRNGFNVPVYYLRGWIDRGRLGAFDKLMLVLPRAMMKLQGLDEYTRPLFDAMTEGGSFYDDSELASVERFVAPRRLRGCGPSPCVMNVP